ncbi:PHD finger protein EHD3-like isoform X2 [Mangifera indica]|uniref:PHD finger protein EHD3-like isoform X2 n=1 Tax=Mangifera indica TaxID=29780 RepID=UPI001CF9C9A8|nr:PHD finger protein EHD3-like isoform X2 [Mangifera indica]
MMGCEEGTSNGDTEWLKRGRGINGIEVGRVQDFGGGRSVASEGFRTYKRRKHVRSTEEAKFLEDSFRIQRKNRNAVLIQMLGSFKGVGGIEECIREAFFFDPEIVCSTIKGSDTHGQDRNKCSQTGILNGCQYSAKGCSVVSGGPLNASNPSIMTNMCRRAFFDILISEKFSLLCKLLQENFGGLRFDKFIDFSVIHARMKEGTYEISPIRFVDDIQLVWGKLQEIGAEMISLANSVAEFSRTSCSEHVGGPIKYDEEKNELFSGETNFDAKMAQPEAGGMNKVCTCRRCEEKADGKDCLVCDSCEEMYHVSCIEPAVKEIPPKNWYCGSCTAKGIGSPHENCVVCERLNAPTNQGILVGDGTSPAYETFIEFEGKSNSNTDEVQESEEKRYLMYPCGICGVRVASCDEFQYCDHDYCPYKLYHNRCLTPKQSKSYGSRWLCPSCLCRGCFTDKDDDKIVLCEACDHAYHIYCMEPPRSSIPKHRWFCRKCEAGLKEIRRVKEVYENKKKKKGDKNIKAYENGQKKKSKEDISHENLEKDLNGKSEEESDGGRGGMDMLLNAAKTLNFEEFGRKEEFKLKRGKD